MTGEPGKLKIVPLSEKVGIMLCVGDFKPCYVGAGTDDAHWRCGTSQCGSDYFAGRSALSSGEDGK